MWFVQFNKHARQDKGRAEELQRSGTNSKGVVDKMWKTGETWTDRENNVDTKVLVQ